MNIPHELNRVGERSDWERFWPGYLYFVLFDSGKIRCTPYGCAIVTRPFPAPGLVDRAFEKMYADD